MPISMDELSSNSKVGKVTRRIQMKNEVYVGFGLHIFGTVLIVDRRDIGGGPNQQAVPRSFISFSWNALPLMSASNHLQSHLPFPFPVFDPPDAHCSSHRREHSKNTHIHSCATVRIGTDGEGGTRSQFSKTPGVQTRLGVAKGHTGPYV
jgi:hypothetical protein